MPKFLVEHTFGKEFFEKSEAEQAEGPKKLKPLLTADAYWVRSYMMPELGKLYCEWDGKDAESIKKVLDKVGMPTDRITEARIVHSEDFR